MWVGQLSKLKCFPTLTDERLLSVKYINKEAINQQFFTSTNKNAGFKKCEMVNCQNKNVIPPQQMKTA